MHRVSELKLNVIHSAIKNKSSADYSHTETGSGTKTNKSCNLRNYFSFDFTAQETKDNVKIKGQIKRRKEREMKINTEPVRVILCACK